MYKFQSPKWSRTENEDNPVPKLTVRAVVAPFEHRKINSKGELELKDPTAHAPATPLVCYYVWTGPLIGEEGE